MTEVVTFVGGLRPMAYIAHHFMRKLVFVWLWLVPFMGAAQLSNLAFEQRMTLTEADSAQLFLGINFLGFGKNNEFSGTTVDGYTLFGYQLNPYLSYNLSKNVRLDAGIYAQKDFGNDDYTEVSPTLSLNIHCNKWKFIFGTLEGSIHHKLIEPLYDFERVLNRRLESGIQAVWSKEDMFLDVWVDWQKMIYQNDDKPERFVFGASFNKTILRTGTFHIDVPLQAVIDHQGGQIDVAGNPVVTRYNGAAGLAIESSSEGFVRAWGLKAYGVGYYSPDQQAFTDGYGFFINPYFQTKFGFAVMGSYWNAEQFITVQGGQLYPSITDNYPGRLDEYRELIMLRFLYDIPITNGLNFTARAEPFYDTYSESFQYSFGIYLNFTDRFFLVNANKPR